MAIAISSLATRSDLFDTVVDRVWRAWWQERGIARDHVDGLFRMATGDMPPFTLVAHDGDRFVGTASGVVSDLDVRPTLSPWVAAVWVEPAMRGAGTGRRLVEAVTARLFALGHERIWLCARPHRVTFYEGLGWRVVETGVGAERTDDFLSRPPASHEPALGVCEEKRGNMQRMPGEPCPRFI